MTQSSKTKYSQMTLYVATGVKEKDDAKQQNKVFADDVIWGDRG